MKKIILSVAAVFAFGFANAQDAESGSFGLAKGDLYLTGAFNLNSITQGDAKFNGFTVAPGVGFLVTENIALEGSLGYSSIKEDNGVNEATISGFGIAVGAKYFFTPADKFSLSIGANISFNSFNEEFVGPDYTEQEIGINVPVGLHYFVSNNFALTTTWGGLGYSSNDNGGENNVEKTNSFALGLDLTAVTFGLIYKL